jgi:hypothetical protein
MQNRLIKTVIALSCLSFILAACAGGAKATQPAPTIVIPTQPAQPSLQSAPPTAILPTALPTAIPSTNTPVLPTSTTAPTAGSASRISMAAGKTEAFAEGALSAGGSVAYLVNAQANQYMMTSFSSANQDLALKITSPDGSVILASADKQNSWQGTLPKTGDYTVSIVAPAAAGGNYDMSVIIPARVVFKTGAVSASLNGYVGAHEVTTYLLRAMQNQTMSVAISAPKNDVFLTIYGLDDGQPYVRSVTGSTSASFKLPSTQDYVIEAVSTGDAAESFAITFTVK